MHSIIRVYALRAVAAGGIGLSVGAAARRLPSAQSVRDGHVKLSAPLVDSICGAAGEISQICILYPLETIKVRCQADSISAGEVLSRLLRHGFGPDVLRQLYSGFGSAAIFSMLVGAVHWLSFCAAKRTAMRVLAPQPTAGGTMPLVAAALPAEQGEGAKAGTKKAKAKRGRGGGSSSSKGGEGGGAAPAGSVSSSAEALAGLGALPPADAQQHMSAKTTANVFASLMGALATALVESPVELFRHQAQAGLISGKLTREMVSAVRARGPQALYFGFLPYCLESFPYDISELGTYSQLRDVYDEVSQPRHALASVMAKYLPAAAADIAIGAAAGAAAVLISMPFDCVKTYIQTNVGTHGAAAVATAASPGVINGVRAFFVTGAGMVARKGPGALFVGVVPRLLQQVPSSTICWWTVEACSKALRPYMDEMEVKELGGH